MIKEKSEKEKEQQFIFYKKFKKAIEDEGERSKFGQLLLQENLICYEIIGILTDIDFYFNFKLQQEMKLHISENTKWLKEKTLGQLINILKFFFSKKEDFIKYLESYSRLRNRLTHRMLFGEYRVISELYVDAKKAFLCGQKVLKCVEKFDKNFDKIVFEI